MPSHKLKYSKQLEHKFGEIPRNSRWFHRRMTDRYKMNLNYLKLIKLQKEKNDLKNMFKIEGILSSSVLTNYRNKASFSIGYSFHTIVNNNKESKENTQIDSNSNHTDIDITINANEKKTETNHNITLRHIVILASRTIQNLAIFFIDFQNS